MKARIEICKAVVAEKKSGGSKSKFGLGTKRELPSDPRR